MDPMSLVEEEKRRKEELELQELRETVLVDEASYFQEKCLCRDISCRGRIVHPSAKQRKILQTVASTIKFPVAMISGGSRRRSTGSSNNANISSASREDILEEESISAIPSDFDLNGKPRVFLYSTALNKHEPDKIIRKVFRKHLFLFNDLIIITVKKDGSNETYEAQNLLYLKDLRLKHSHYENAEERKTFFDLISLFARRSAGVKATLQFSCDNEASWQLLVEELESALLAYHKQMEISRSLGWFHEVIQGNIFSASYLGDSILLRRYLKDGSPDTIDVSGMAPLHWAAIRGNEVCVRLLLDRGAEIDLQQKGMNTPLLLAAAFGHDTISRLLIERGANLNYRNHRGHGCVFMTVLYGHATKGLPWLLQLFYSKGLDLNEVDSAGATPLHLCAEKNLARPVRMLVDSGADVNAKHGRNQLTPLQLACSHEYPDVETIRSFLDKGANPNWKDLNGRTAFDLVVRGQATNAQRGRPNPRSNDLLDSISIDDSQDPSLMKLDANQDTERGQTFTQSLGSDKWRAMEGTLSEVGDWAVRALPVLLELCKKGARFENKDIESFRPSFRAAVIEAKEMWEKKAEPSGFLEFVNVREQAGEDLRLHKAGWSKDKASTICQLCSDGFSLTNRRHHCRACGILTCDRCSSKRLSLTANETEIPANSNASNKEKKKDDRCERVCDGCFNRLIHESSQPSPDHFRVRQLKQCALDVIASMEELIDVLEDPDGLASGYSASLRESASLTKDLESIRINNTRSSATNSAAFISPASRRSSAFSLVKAASPSPPPPPTINAPSPIRSSEALVDVLKLRDSCAYRSEDVVAKFLEAVDGYHHVTKKLIEQKLENSRLWGNSGTP